MTYAAEAVGALAGDPPDQVARGRIRSEIGRGLFVEAGAGTGKTHELVERIHHVVTSGEQPVPLANVAAITFTEKAAGELRERVRQRLELDPGPAARAALAQIDQAALTTLHGFAHRILADHPVEAGIPPGFEVRDDVAASLDFDARWRAFTGLLFSDPACADALEASVGLGLTVRHLWVLATALHESWDLLSDGAFPEVPAPTTAAVDVSEAVRWLDVAVGLEGECINRSGDDLPETLRLVVAPLAARLRASSTPGALAAAVRDLSLLKITEGTTRAGNWKPGVHTKIKDAVKAAKNAGKAAWAPFATDVIAFLAGRIASFTRDGVRDRIGEGVLEFHDLLVLCRNLLRDDDRVRARVAGEFRRLLVDEFQDTDPLQAEIVALIAGDEADERLFFVGDPKQSIYRFRRADLGVYQGLRPPADGDGLVQLTHSFRSLSPIVAWVNAVFRPVLTKADSTTQAAWADLSPERRTGAEGDAAQAAVTVIGGPFDGPVGVARELEAVELVELVATAVGTGWQVGTREGWRPARYRDVAILIPTRATLASLERELRRRRVPYRVEARSLVWATQEVRDLLALLAAIDDPSDQVAVVAALRSPALACTDAELAHHAVGGGRWDPRRADPEGAGPVAEGLAWIREMHARRWWMGVGELVEEVVRQRRILELAFAHSRQREAWNRVQFVLDHARAFESAGVGGARAAGTGAGLREFVAWAQEQADAGARAVESPIPADDDDAVRIMTIHAAKGLEFPIVAVAGLSSRSPAGETTRVLWGPDGPEVQLGYKDMEWRTAGFDALEGEDKRLDTEEMARLLYVACTRARDHLIVSMYRKQNDRLCPAAMLAEEVEAAAAAGLHRAGPGVPEMLPPPLPEDAPLGEPHDPTPTQEAWEAARVPVLAAARSQVVAATALKVHAPDPADPADEAAAPWAPLAVEPDDGDPLDDEDAAGEGDGDGRPAFVPRLGHVGTARGRALHTVLQTCDLGHPDDPELVSVVRSQAVAEGVPDEVSRIVAMARSAMASPAVGAAAAAGQRGRMWREVYVGVPLGDGAVLEGFVDLLYEDEHGDLVVVDYKTDAVTGRAGAEARAEEYRMQAAAYAFALERQLGRPVPRAVLVFCALEPALEVEVRDLARAVAEVEPLTAAIGAPLS